MSQWQPIKTAPKDRDVLLWFREFHLPGPGLVERHHPTIVVGQIVTYPDPDIEPEWWTDFGYIGEPSYWMPLPDTPWSRG